MTQAQSTSLATIDFIIAALDTGTAARIMSGRQVTGHFAPVSPPPGAPVSPAPTARWVTLVSSCGSMGVTSREDTKLFVWRSAATSAGYQAVTSPPSKPRIPSTRPFPAPELFELRSATGLLPKFMLPAVRLCAMPTGRSCPLICVN